MKSNPRIQPPCSYVRPDGGYGWFIVFATFLCYVCVSGTTKANGLFFVYFLETFGASNSATSSITFVQKISETVTALIWSILAERFGSRIIVFCGAITTTIGALLSVFAPNISVLTITYGVICGMSFSMINYPAVQMLPRYFEKRLVIATALIYCGTPIGSLTVPYILTQAVSAYGLSSAFFIVAGVLFHVFIAAALLRPLSNPTHLYSAKAKGVDVDVTDGSVASENGVITADIHVCPCRRISQCVHKPTICTCIINEVTSESSDPSVEAVTLKREQSADEVTITASTFLKQPSLLASVSAMASPLSMKKPKLVTLLSSKSKVIQEEEKAKAADRSHYYPSPPENLRMRRLKSQLSTGSVSSVAAVENMAVSFAIMDNIDSASVQNITAISRQLSAAPYMNRIGSRVTSRVDKRQSKIDEPAASRTTSIIGTKSVGFQHIPPTLSHPTPPSSSASEHSASGVDEETAAEVSPQSSPSILRALVKKYRSIVRDKLFLMLAFSNFLHSFGMSLWVIFQQAYIIDLGYHDSFRQIFLISASSFSELASRLSLGFIISRNWLPVYRWNQIACALMAVTFFTYPFVTSYPILVLYNCFVTSVFSINVVTSMPNLKEFLGIEMAALGQGLMVVPVGLGIVSVQIGGAIRDYCGSFVPAFYMGGFALLLSAINFQLVGYLSHHQHLPFRNCLAQSGKDITEDENAGVVTETLLSNHTQDITLTTPGKQQTADNNHLDVPVSLLKTPRNFTDEVIEMLQKGQSPLSPNEQSHE